MIAKVTNWVTQKLFAILNLHKDEHKPEKKSRREEVARQASIPFSGHRTIYLKDFIKLSYPCLPL